MSKVLLLLCNYLCPDIAKLIISYCWRKGYIYCIHDGNYEEYFDTLSENNMKVSTLEFGLACANNYHEIIKKMFQIGFQCHPTYYLQYACSYNQVFYVNELLKLSIKQSNHIWKDTDYVKLHMQWYKSLMIACKNGNLDIIKVLHPSLINDINDGILIAKKYKKNNYEKIINYLKKCKTDVF